MGDVVFLDIECYTNYFLICLKHKETFKTYELYKNVNFDHDDIRRILENYTTVGFNSKSYDLPMLSYALQGKNNLELKEMSDRIILRKKEDYLWDMLRDFNVNVPRSWDHIDLINIPKGIAFHSLKTYGARIHTSKLQDLPYDPSDIIDDVKRDNLVIYCKNDLNITSDLYNKLKEDIILRKNISNIYKIDLRSSSKAQIAEKLIRHNLKSTGKDILDFGVQEAFKYKAPEYLEFKDCKLKELKQLFENSYVDLEDKKAIKNLYSHNINIENTTYQVGIGGLHSTESHRSIIKDDDEFLIDLDVVSYYPSMIINNNYTPKHLGQDFLDIFKGFYNERLKAKENKDEVTSSTFKIILNGSFGKFGSQFSCLYDKTVLLQTTITGQLNLLFLIEKMENAHFRVVSANTDGVIVKGKVKDLDIFNSVVKEWENITNLTLEQSPITAIYNESVNSYIAIKEDGKLKLKGNYTKDSLDKNPDLTICKEAVINYLTKKTPIMKTIIECRDITKFIIVRTVRGGAEHKGNYLGKIVRWYYIKDGSPITYVSNGNKVARSDGSKPVMDLPDEFPKDIDYRAYLQISCNILEKLGV